MTTRRRQVERWWRLALCQRFAHLPWTADAHTCTPAAVAAMRTVCLACPVRAACEAAVVDEGIVAGFWAGTHRDHLSASLSTRPTSRTSTTSTDVVVGGAA